MIWFTCMVGKIKIHMRPQCPKPTPQPVHVCYITGCSHIIHIHLNTAFLLIPTLAFQIKVWVVFYRPLAAEARPWTHTHTRGMRFWPRPAALSFAKKTSVMWADSVGWEGRSQWTERPLVSGTYRRGGVLIQHSAWKSTKVELQHRQLEVRFMHHLSPRPSLDCCKPTATIQYRGGCKHKANFCSKTLEQWKVEYFSLRRNLFGIWIELYFFYFSPIRAFLDLAPKSSRPKQSSVLFLLTTKVLNPLTSKSAIKWTESEVVFPSYFFISLPLEQGAVPPLRLFVEGDLNWPEPSSTSVTGLHVPTSAAQSILFHMWLSKKRCLQQIVY